ncbi:Transporter [Candidatus Accumulibacter phosphatis]|uniref:Transporter n=1 Tax=Candidatus Accumulibacter phosphatis TaxID=327160 RepID=A0A5S4ELE5_9PROT|nr:Transporter [Candidatus Accumulibacter phosphatis]
MRRPLIKRYFITGLLIWVPLAITAWVLVLIVGAMDQSLRLLPEAIHPRTVLGFDIPGVGAVLTLLIIFLTGLLAANFIGQRLVAWWELLLARIPVVNSIYHSVKQVSDTLFSSSGNAFRKALLIEYPRRGSWTIAFLTGQPAGEMLRHLDGEHVSVYIPTTPNPTSGFFLMLPRTEVIELDMSVDTALKYVISMGVVAPPLRPQTANASSRP